MRLRWYDRILVALSGLIFIALGIGVILAAGGVIKLPEALAFDTWLGTGWQWMPLIFAAGILLVVWGFWLLIRPFRRGSEAGGRYYTLQSEADGNVRISVHAIDHLVRKCLDQYGQIASAKVRISGREDAMGITLHLVLHSDVRIPQLLEEVRADIKRSLLQSAGVTVQTVQMYVDATKDDKPDSEVKYLEAPGKAEREDPRADFINTPDFNTTPVVVTDEEEPVDVSAVRREPTVAELRQEVDLGPDEPLPVDLSAQAFPFPEKDAGVPLEIYTQDIPIADESREDDDDV